MKNFTVLLLSLTALSSLNAETFQILETMENTKDCPSWVKDWQENDPQYISECHSLLASGDSYFYNDYERKIYVLDIDGSEKFTLDYSLFKGSHLSVGKNKDVIFTHLYADGSYTALNVNNQLNQINKQDNFSSISLTINDGSNPFTTILYLNSKNEKSDISYSIARVFRQQSIENRYIRTILVLNKNKSNTEKESLTETVIINLDQMRETAFEVMKSAKREFITQKIMNSAPSFFYDKYDFAMSSFQLSSRGSNCQNVDLKCRNKELKFLSKTLNNNLVAPSDKKFVLPWLKSYGVQLIDEVYAEADQIFQTKSGRYRAKEIHLDPNLETARYVGLGGETVNFEKYNFYLYQILF